MTLMRVAQSISLDFLRDGYTVIPDFYDIETEIVPIQEGIRQIIEIACHKYGVSAPTDTAMDAMTLGYSALIQRNRAWGGEIYDAVKQIPAFMRLVSNARNDEVFRVLRPDSLPGLAAGGYGIRIDNPNEEKFRAPWHQEFPAQLRSVDGVVFWTPLLSLTPDMGPVEIAAGSHAEGLVPVYEDNMGIGKSGAYALRLDRESERLSKYKRVAPLSKPGDLILMDFLTLHQSGVNTSKRPRWSIQFRYFNYKDPIGVKIGWQGSFAVGVKFSEILPELVVLRGASS